MTERERIIKAVEHLRLSKQTKAAVGPYAWGYDAALGEMVNLVLNLDEIERLNAEMEALRQ